MKGLHVAMLALAVRRPLRVRRARAEQQASLAEQQRPGRRAGRRSELPAPTPWLVEWPCSRRRCRVRSRKRAPYSRRHADIDAFKTKTGIEARAFDTLGRLALCPDGWQDEAHDTVAAPRHVRHGGNRGRAHAASRAITRAEHAGRASTSHLNEEIKLFGLLRAREDWRGRDDRRTLAEATRRVLRATTPHAAGPLAPQTSPCSRARLPRRSSLRGKVPARS